MKVRFLLLIGSVLMACTNKYENTENIAADYLVIPNPVSLTPADGKFEVTQKTKIVTTDSLMDEADYLAGLLKKAIESEPVITAANEPDNNIQLQLDP